MADPIKKIELKDGTVRYRFVIDIGHDPETGKRKQQTCTFNTKTQAKSEYARIKHECDRGTYVRPHKLTVDEFLDEWLASATRDVEKATAANYRDALLPVRERCGKRLLQSLTETDVEKLVDWILTGARRRGGAPGTGLSVRSASLTLSKLRTALNVAVRRQLVVRNVAAFVTIPRAARKAEQETQAKRTPWTTEEVKTFLAGIREERLFSVMLLSLLGLRPAEVCGLRWIDVDFEAGTIAAGKNTRTLADGQVEEKGAKSAAGNRGLPGPGVVMAALKAFKTLQTTERLAAGDAYSASGYVLVDELGAPQRTDWLRRRAYELMEKVGVRGKGEVRLYDCRHSCLTFLGGAGVPDVVLAAWAGHADGGTLAKRVYIHPDMSHLRAATEQLDALLG
ncbi:site-specific integrase [Nonomuraea guangzhouensis]|uniref:Tyrosine recombinase XerC n=1 Tax=Nonomuraea guangzhouensis TaxID=1291555 RepID=A0ABW4GYW1_9ACTN|nr:tyrosine-type recombinase/integrase [Nonomuraea guangzhouensis]